MNKRNTGTVVNMKKLDRPSLYEAGAAGSSDAQFSILEALEPRRGKLWGRRGRIWVAALGLAVAAVLVISSSPALRNESLPSVVKTEPSQQVLILKPESAPMLASVAPHAAAMTSVAEPPPAPQEAQNAVARVDDVEETPATTPAAEVTHPVQETKASTPKTTVLNANSPGTPPKKVAAARKEAAKTTKHDSGSKAKVTPSKAKSKDKDVELIAALLSHVARPVAGGNQSSHGKPGTASAQHAVAVAAAPGRDRSSEIVVRGPGDSTESLVKRCKALGFIEGELCRVRICSGLWGKDPACPSGSDKAADVR